MKKYLLLDAALPIFCSLENTRRLIVFSLSFIFLLAFFLQSPSIFNQNALAASVQCTCDHPGQADDPNNPDPNKRVLNGYHCTDGYKSTCVHQEESCITKPGNTITTQTSGGGRFSQPTITNYVGVACQVGTANNGKQAITCGCAGPKNKAGKQTSIKCTNNVTNTTQTQSCGDSVCVTGSNYSYGGFSNQTIQGIGCEQLCVCQDTNGSPGSKSKTGDGNNGKRCYDAQGNLGSLQTYCTNREDYCQNDPSKTNGINCVNSSTCTCNSNNQVVCTSKGSGPGGKDENQTFDCGDKQCKTGSQYSHDFANQQVPGADCQPKVVPTLPPPPSPPCQAWSNGTCTAFPSAFGAFATNPSGFIKTIFAILLSVSGGIALLLIIKAGYQLMTSQGKPEQIQAGRDQLIAAIVGLLFLIFSFVFLQLIGFDILHIPGFGG